MNDFLEDLLFYCLEKEGAPSTLRQHRNHQALEEMEEQIGTVMGEEFRQQYIRAALRSAQEESVDAFRVGLRLGVRLMCGAG